MSQQVSLAADCSHGSLIAQSHWVLSKLHLKKGYVAENSQPTTPVQSTQPRSAIRPALAHAQHSRHWQPNRM